MRILYRGADNFYSSWGARDGIAATLRTMGHTVVAEEPCDWALLCGVEHLGFDRWENIQAPKAGWFDETTGRDDGDLTECYQRIRDKLELAFFSSRHDAKQFSGCYLPFGVDTTLFQPRKGWHLRKHEKAFQGQLYEKRRKFAEASGIVELGVKLLSPTPLQEHPGLRAMDLVYALSDIKIFVTLPSASRAFVPKAVEGMACGCAVVYPELTGDFEADMNLFSEGAPIFYYDAEKPESLARILSGMANTSAFATTVRDGPLEVLRHHRLDLRMADILSHMGEWRR